MTDDPYGSHVPFLSTLGGEVRSVLELGCGMHSTHLFLNKLVFPKLERLMSIEHDREWAFRMPEDPRLTLVVMSRPVEDFLAMLDYRFDLVLVDNSHADDRIRSIKWLSRLRWTRVVIHDFEHDFYQAAAAGFEHKQVDTSRVPHTALVWND